MPTDHPSAAKSENRFFEADSRRDAFARLAEGLGGHGAFVLVTGDAGIGKTAFVRAAIERWGPAAAVAFVANPAMSRTELLEEIVRRFGVEPPANANKPQLLACLEQVIRDAAGRSQTPAIVIDDAHDLTSDLLGELKLLSNAVAQAGVTLEIVLVGLPDLESRLTEPALASLRQRIGTHCRLLPLTVGETRRYLEEVVCAALREGPGLFPRKTGGEVFRRTRGVPGAIHSLAAEAIRRARESGTRIVSVEIAQEAALALGFAEPLGGLADALVDDAPESRPTLPVRESSPVAPAPAAKPPAAPASQVRPALTPPAQSQPAPPQSAQPQHAQPRPARAQPTRTPPALSPPAAPQPAKASPTGPPPAPAPAARESQVVRASERRAAPAGSDVAGAVAKPPTPTAPPAAPPDARPIEAAGDDAPRKSVAREPKPVGEPPTKTPPRRAETGGLRPIGEDPPPDPTLARDWVGRFIGPDEPRFGSLFKAVPRRAEGSGPSAEAPRPAQQSHSGLLEESVASMDEASSVPVAAAPPRRRSAWPLRFGQFAGRRGRPSWAAPAAVALFVLTAVGALVVLPRTRQLFVAARTQQAATAPPAAEQPSTTNADKKKPKRSGPRHYTLEVGTYLNADLAEAERDRLVSETGLQGWVATSTSDGATVYRVVVGSYSTTDRAEQSADVLVRRDLVAEAQVVPLPPRRQRR